MSRKRRISGSVLAVFAVAMLNVAAAQEGRPAVLDPGQDRGDQYGALSDEINRQLAAMQGDYESRQAQVLAEIERRRDELYASTEDVFARNDQERALNQLKQQAINELQSELGINRRTLSELRSRASAELGQNGVLSEAMWGSIIDFAAAHALALPDGFSAPEVDVEDYEGLPAAIYDCEEYNETFRHPWTGDQMRRTVFGIIEDRCHFGEQLPGGGLLTCQFSMERLPAVADFYANAEKYENMEISSNTEFFDGVAVTTNTYIVDGEPYDHPIDVALRDGECVVSGY